MSATTYANEVTAVTAVSRPRAAQARIVSNGSPAFWAPITLGTAMTAGTNDRKHGQPRPTQESP